MERARVCPGLKCYSVVMRRNTESNIVFKLFPKKQEVWKALQQQQGAAVFRVPTRDQISNATRHLSQLVPLVRRVGSLNIGGGDIR